MLRMLASLSARGTEDSDNNLKRQRSAEVMEPAGFHPVDDKHRLNLGGYVEDVIMIAEDDPPLRLSVAWLLEQFRGWVSAPDATNPYADYGCPNGVDPQHWLSGTLEAVRGRLLVRYPHLFE